MPFHGRGISLAERLGVRPPHRPRGRCATYCRTRFSHRRISTRALTPNVLSNVRGTEVLSCRQLRTTQHDVRNSSHFRRIDRKKTVELRTTACGVRNSRALRTYRQSGQLRTTACGVRNSRALRTHEQRLQLLSPYCFDLTRICHPTTHGLGNLPCQTRGV